MHCEVQHSRAYTHSRYSLCVVFFCGSMGSNPSHMDLQSESVGGDSLVIYYIGFRGDSRSPKKDVSQKLEIPAANAADASLTDRVTEKAAGQQTTAR